MADILIRGMDMPSSCCECRFIKLAFYGDYQNREQGFMCLVNGKRVDNGNGYLDRTSVDSDCPLIELQPHGDLIDRDELINVFANLIPYIIDESNGLYVDGLNSSYDALCCAPTIIEASEVE